MTRLRILFSRFVHPFARGRREQELAEEIEVHLAFLTEEHMRHGMSAEDARTAARRDFGAVEPIKEACRDQRGFAFFDSLLRDLVFALRMLARDPWVTGVILLVLGLGLGASTPCSPSPTACCSDPCRSAIRRRWSR